ncbi:hypothetical protein K0M31_013520, partial [Melipona bicolor]
IFHRFPPGNGGTNDDRLIECAKRDGSSRSAVSRCPLLGLAVFAEKEYKMWPSPPGREACNYHEWAIYLSPAFAVAEEGQLEEERIFFAGRGRP